MDLPKYIQLDFLFVVFGAVTFGFTNYILFMTNRPVSLMGSLYLTFLIIMGIFFLVFGLKEMFRNYDRDNELQNLRVRKEGTMLKKYLNKYK